MTPADEIFIELFNSDDYTDKLIYILSEKYPEYLIESTLLDCLVYIIDKPNKIECIEKYAECRFKESTIDLTYLARYYMRNENKKAEQCIVDLGYVYTADDIYDYQTYMKNRLLLFSKNVCLEDRNTTILLHMFDKLSERVPIVIS